MKISVIMVDGSFRERFYLTDLLNNQTLPRRITRLSGLSFIAKISVVLRIKMR